jgi:cytochrome bd-type quinol oxidase subunit 2
MKALTLSSARKAVVATIIAILILTVLEFPAPIGFETRPQTDVSFFRLIFFVIILIVEIATIPMIYKRKNIGVGLGVFAAILNILQVIADQSHLMQPEIAPLGYSTLEGLVVIASLALTCFAWSVRQSAQPQKENPRAR